MKKIIKGIVSGFVVFLVLAFSLALFDSISFKGTCGFLSEPCTVIEYFQDSLSWVFIFLSILFLPIAILIGAIIGYLAHRLGKSHKWIYLTNVFVFIIALVVYYFDLLNLY